MDSLAEERESLTPAQRIMRVGWEAFSGALPERYASCVGLEIEAENIWQWETQVVPGLLQTEAHAQSVEELRHLQEPSALPDLSP